MAPKKNKLTKAPSLAALLKQAQESQKTPSQTPPASAVEKIRAKRPTFADVVGFKFGGTAELARHVETAKVITDSDSQSKLVKVLTRCMGHTMPLSGYTNSKSKETLAMMMEVSGMLLSKDGQPRPLSKEELGYVKVSKPRAWDVLSAVAVLFKVYASEALGTKPSDDEHVAAVRRCVASAQRKLDEFRRSYEKKEAELKQRLSIAQRTLGAVRAAEAKDRKAIVEEFLEENNFSSIGDSDAGESSADSSSSDF